MKMLRRSLATLVWIAVWIVVSAQAFAQTDTATVIGTVADTLGGVVPGVSITATNVETGFTLASISDAEGRYRIAAIPPGQYEFRAELQGFADAVRRGVILTLGSESVINLELAPADVAEEVTVTADSPVVQTTTSTVQATMNREQIDLLPLIGRNVESLLRLTPAYQNNNGTAFAGGRGRSNQWLIDGTDNSADITGNSRLSATIDSIREFQVLVNNFRAEFGRATGGIVNVITRSGTNDLSGTAFFLFRDERFMSRSPYAERFEPTGEPRPKDPFQRLHYGGTAGGPLVRDKLHLFVAYDREDRDTFTSSTVTLPSASAGFASATRQYLDTLGVDTARFGPGGRRRLVRPEFVNVHKATVRIDNQISRDQFLMIRHILYHSRTPSGQATLPTVLDYAGNAALDRDNYLTVNHKWIASSHALNELFFQIGQTRFDSRAYLAIPRITVTDNFSVGPDPDDNQARTDYVFQVADHFTWTRSAGRFGDHVLKAGADIKIFRSDGYFDSNFHGTLTFPSLQRFLDGRPSVFTQRRGDSGLQRPNQIYGFYIQDDWRPRPSLTLNLGLRYDYEGAKTEALRDVTGRPGPGISKDKNNVAPRFGFVWAPGNSTTQAFYGGAGVYYDQIILNIQGNARFTPPKVTSVRIDTPPFPNVFAGVERIPPPAVQVVDPDLVTPYSVSGTIGYRRELLADLGLDVSFLYRREWDQILRNDDNAGIPGTARLDGTNRVRPDPAFDSVQVYRNQGFNRYKALIVDLHKRFGNSVQGGFAYTLSTAVDNGVNFLSSYQIVTHPHLNNGPGTDDRRHRISSHAEITLPWDVQLGAIVEYRSEAPLSITAARDLNGDGVTGDWVNEQVCTNIACPGDGYSRNSVRELTTEEANRLRRLFGLQPIGAFEDNPKYFNTDVTLQKRFRSGGQGFKVTAEAFNIFNIPQRNQPTQSITSSLFGRRNSVDQPRAVQLTFQYEF